MWNIIVLIGIFFLTFLVIIGTAQIYLSKRNDEVCYFLMKLILMAYDYNVRRVNEGDLNYKCAYNWFFSKYSYEELLYSVKPLELQYWFTEEEIKEINR